MTEKDIEKISQEYKDEKAPLYEKIHERVEDMIVQQASKRKKLTAFYKVLPVALAMVLILSLAIVLPIVLQSDETTPGGDTPIRYSDLELVTEPLPAGDNLKKYASDNKESYLYIDMYEIAEDVETYRIYQKDDENVTVYLQESFIHGETGYFVRLTVMKSNIIVDSFDTRIKDSQDLFGYDVDIRYEIGRQKSNAQFEYEGYKYYLELKDEIDESFLTEIIDNMFNTQQAVA